MSLRPWPLCALFLVAACLADPDLPDDVGARTPCVTSSDCPDGFACPRVVEGQAAHCVSLRAAACGNARVDEGETCDFGDWIDDDGCTASCTLERCGDGVQQRTEACDDGNRASGDGCRADCAKVERCGDEVVDDGETCDDGNENPADGCTDCQTTTWSAALLLAAAAGDPLHLPNDGALRDLARDRAGNLYFATDHAAWRVDVRAGRATRVAGTGVVDDSGLPLHNAALVPATRLKLVTPSLAVNADGTMFLGVSESGRNRVYRVGADGIAVLVATEDSTAREQRTPLVALNRFGGLSVVHLGLNRLDRLEDDGGRLALVQFAGCEQQAPRCVVIDDVIATSDATFQVKADGKIFTWTAGHPFSRHHDVPRPPFIEQRFVDVDGKPVDLSVARALVPGDRINRFFAALPGRVVDVSADGVVRTLVDADVTALVVDDATVYGVRAGAVERFAGATAEVIARVDPEEAAAGPTAPVSVAVSPTGALLVATSKGDALWAIEDGRATPVDVEERRVASVVWTGAGTALAAMSGSGLVLSLQEVNGVFTTEPFMGSTGYDPPLPVEVEDLGSAASIALSSDGRTIYVGDAIFEGLYAIDASTLQASRVAPDYALRNDALAVGRDGSLFVAEASNHRVVRIAPDGSVTRVLGTGEPRSGADAAPANDVAVRDPRGLAVDAFGNLFVAATDAVRMVTADDNGVVDGTGPLRTIYGRALHDGFPETETSCLSGLAAKQDGALVVVDECTSLVIELAAR